MTHSDILHKVIRQNKIYAELLVYGLAQNKATLSIAESITGGLLSSTITDIPGSSKVFLDGLVTYSIDAKVKRLGLDQDTINSNGVISMETAKNMALAVRKGLLTEYSIGITGNAGPTVNQKGTPVGLFYIAVCSPRQKWIPFPILYHQIILEWKLNI